MVTGYERNAIIWHEPLDENRTPGERRDFFVTQTYNNRIGVAAVKRIVHPGKSVIYTNGKKLSKI